MFRLPGDAYVYAMEDKLTVALTPDFDGARITVNVSVWTTYTSGDTEQRMIDFTARLTATKDRNAQLWDLPTLTTLQSAGLYATNTSPTTVKLVGHISSAALRELEELRDGGDFHLGLTHLKGMLLDKQPALRLHQAEASAMTIRVRGGGEWAEQVQEVTNASYIDLMIPIIDDPELATAAARLNQARDLIRAGHFNVAVQLRQVLDPVREYYDTLNAYKEATAAGVKPKDRTEVQRFAMVVQSTYAWLSSYIHDDEEVIKGLDMDRAEAVQALGNVAGLLYRMGRDKRTAGTV
ncbi:MAG TPA: hypothetical protein VGS97_05025 [Actinocrinis sp.]|uniref:hypothetical protein n=1 Tax=Actinocrinis sp. TaxID=1920516 RepID=UPI002DDCEF96|nr:hypothetical protein [Actinocrinis sp.]HEV2343435.1 hypothetical protein [Actinocrinis sp.]